MSGADGYGSDKPSYGRPSYGGEKPPEKPCCCGLNLSAVFAEFISMFLFVYTCCGAAMSTANGDSKAFKIALTFGLAIAALAYTVGHHSGAQINCAVTFALVIAGELSFCQGLANFGAQLLGAVFGSLMTAATIEKAQDLTGNLGSNFLQPGFGEGNAFLGEVIMTALLCYVVLETAISKASQANRMIAPLSIGFAVFLGHSILIPIDGCSINPTRSFGPAVVASWLDHGNNKEIWEQHWIFWIGPLLGAAVAVGIYKLQECMKPDSPGIEVCCCCCGDGDDYGSSDEYGTTEMVQTTVVEEPKPGYGNTQGYGNQQPGPSYGQQPGPSYGNPQPGPSYGGQQPGPYGGQTGQI